MEEDTPLPYIPPQPIKYVFSSEDIVRTCDCPERIRGWLLCLDGVARPVTGPATWLADDIFTPSICQSSHHMPASVR